MLTALNRLPQARRPTKRRMFAVVAALSIAAPPPASAVGDGNHGSSGHGMGDMHGMSHSGHAMHAHGDEHGATSGDDASHGSPHDASHGAEAVAKDQPVGLVLAAFAGLNGLILIAALLLRSRPSSIKRRETLARVRDAAGTRTAVSAEASP